MQKIKQLSLFVENRPGALSEVCRVLKENNVNIRTLSLADTQQFGILRLLVDESETAKAKLEKAGFVVKLSEVIAVSVVDRPGGLNSLFEKLDRSGISVEYMYAFAANNGGKAVMVFKFDDPGKAEKVLADAGTGANE